MAPEPQKEELNLQSKEQTSRSTNKNFNVHEVDNRMPMLAYIGLACWMLWNTIAFSGSFWLYDITDSIRSENLVTVSAITSVLTMFVLGYTEQRSRRFITKRWFTLVSGLLGTIGTVLIIITRQAIFPSRGLFLGGCAIAGLGMGGLFMRSAPMLGASVPSRSLWALLICLLTDSLGYLYLSNCHREVATTVFALLPLIGGLLYAIHSSDTPKETQIMQPLSTPPNKLLVFFVSVALCSAALELIRAYIVIGFPPSVSVDCTVSARLCLVPILLAVLIALLFFKEDATSQFYTAIVSVLVVLLIVLGAFPSKNTIIAGAAIGLCSFFQVVVWSMLAYIAFQAQSGAIKLFGYGNGALYLGTVISSLIAMVYQNSGISDDIMRLIVVIVGIIVLIDVLFVFTGKHIGNLMQPIDERLYSEDTSEETFEESPDNHKGRFVRACEDIAAANGLSPRETEVLVELARGWTAQEIAEQKTLSIYTVRAHIRSIYAKLDVHSGKELREYISEQ